MGNENTYYYIYKSPNDEKAPSRVLCKIIKDGETFFTEPLISGYKSGILYTRPRLKLSKKIQSYIFDKILTLEYLLACGRTYKIIKFKREWLELSVAELNEIANHYFANFPMAKFYEIKKTYKLRNGRESQLLQRHSWTGTPLPDVLFKKYKIKKPRKNIKQLNFRYKYYFIPCIPWE